MRMEQVPSDHPPAVRWAETDQSPRADVADLLTRVRDAFEQFGNQSALLRRVFDGLKRDLASVNAELNTKNEVLSGKILELEHMSRRLRCVLESLTDGVLVVNEQYRVERVNPVAAGLLNLPSARIEGRSYAEITNGLGSRDALREAIECGRTTLDQQRSHVDATGKTVVVLASVAPIHGRMRAVQAR